MSSSCATCHHELASRGTKWNSQAVSTSSTTITVRTMTTNAVERHWSTSAKGWQLPDALHIIIIIITYYLLKQRVSFPTHRDLHTLDLVITASSSSLSPIIDHSPASPSDYSPIFSTLTISLLPPPPLLTFSFRCLKSISISKYNRDIVNSRLITHPHTNFYDLVYSYNTTLSSLLDKHAPLKTKTISAKTTNP